MRGLSSAEIPSIREALRNGELFFVPLAAIIGALALGYAATYAAMFGTIAVYSVALLRKETRIGLAKLYDVLAEATVKVIGVTAAFAAAGGGGGGLGLRR